MPYKIGKEKLLSWLKELSKEHDVVVPTSRGESYIFDVYREGMDVCLGYDTTILPIKKFLFPPEETILSFKNGEPAEPKGKTEKTIFFGLHPCDLLSIKILDAVAKTDFEDPYYLDRRKNVLLVGLNCKEAHDFCFCESVKADKADGYDLLLTDIGDDFLVEKGTEKGEALVKACKDMFSEVKESEKKLLPKKFQKGFDLSKLRRNLAEGYNSLVWDEISDLCLNCGACALCCPTCYCYSVQDKTSLDREPKERVRMWDTCLYKDFSNVAGGHAFMATPEARLKHRMYHKFQYFQKKYGFPACTGCGRCIRQCPPGIDIRDVAKKLEEDHEKSLDAKKCGHKKH